MKDVGFKSLCILNFVFFFNVYIYAADYIFV